jgi:threonine dehydrogenase-like Zn-dependent dehydrogenase
VVSVSSANIIPNLGRLSLTCGLVLGYLQKDFAGVIDALADGHLKPERMITGKIKIDRVPEDGYRPLIEEKDKHVKILVDCRA